MGIVKSTSGKYAFKTGNEILKIDPRYFRPTEVDLLIGDPTKANEKLGWKPKYTLKEMVAEMVAADLQEFQQKKLLKDSGFHVSNQYE